METILSTGNIYHVFNKSIAGFKIFNHSSDFWRMSRGISYCQTENQKIRFARYILNEKSQDKNDRCLDCKNLVDVIAYCIMPTHIHLILRQLSDKGISTFMGNLLNSYTKYFNTKYKRKGPLWEGRFKKVSIMTDEQLLHLTRYIHLNPVTAYLVNLPEEWGFSSYKEYLNEDAKPKICKYNDVLDIKPQNYRDFVIDHIDHQRCIAKIKGLVLEQNSMA